jgi:DNA polymerase III delta prime subunit
MIGYTSIMHAFLIVGNSGEGIKSGIEDLRKKLQAKILEFSLSKIEDVRNLNNLIRLSFDEPTLIVSENIHEAGEEALNAFLKNLEEPQENIYFALTAPSTRKVLATIVSRCEVVRTKNLESGILDDETEKFLKLSIGEKLAYIDKIKERQEAIELVENTAFLLHRKLHSDQVKYGGVVKDIEATTQTLTRLKANGNVNLQLANLSINLE